MKIKDKIMQAISLAEDNDYTIVRGTYYKEEDKVCCPIGAVALFKVKKEETITLGWRKEKEQLTHARLHKALVYLNRSINWRRGFAKGFDGIYKDDTIPYKEKTGYNLGKEILLELGDIPCGQINEK